MALADGHLLKEGRDEALTIVRLRAALTIGAVAWAQSTQPKPYQVVFDLTTDDPQDQTAVLRWLREVESANPQSETSRLRRTASAKSSSNSKKVGLQQGRSPLTEAVSRGYAIVSSGDLREAARRLEDGTLRPNRALPATETARKLQEN